MNDKAKWVGGLAEWIEDGVVYLSVAFSWKIEAAYSRAVWYRDLGYKVRVGGPAVFVRKHDLEDVAEVGGDYPDAIAHHNPSATIASRGCPVGCWFCIVPKMEGKTFTLLPDFPVRPILCDNNLSALPMEYQKHIISRYQQENVPLLDANSGFEPRTFTEEVFHLWKPINRGPWRFAFDDMQEITEVDSVMKILKDEPASKKRVYVLIGNEPFAECMARIRFVINSGCEPHVQPYIKLNALERKPKVRFDWTEQKLIDVARWANAWVWRKCDFAEYDRYRKTVSPEAYNEQVGMFA